MNGWGDPRMPTVQGILRRGLQIEALKEFILSQGASKNVTYQEWDKIWAINKKLIDPVCPRHTAVIREDKVLINLSGAPDEVIEVPRHLKYPPAGVKKQIRSGVRTFVFFNLFSLSKLTPINMLFCRNCGLTKQMPNC